MNIKVKRLTDQAILPSQGSKLAAGFDLCADCEKMIPIFPHTTEVISTGISMEIPEGYFGGIYARSGLATRDGIRPSNCVGVIDSDYRGEIKVALYNDSEKAYMIVPKQRIAQLVIQPCMQIDFEEVKELEKTERAEGGFGSTGV